jgi:hypothetical protein
MANEFSTDRIDVIATDHAPHTLEEKSNTYFNAPSGGPLVQHSLVAAMEMVRQGRLPITTLVQKMSHNPAILFKSKTADLFAKATTQTWWSLIRMPYRPWKSRIFCINVAGRPLKAPFFIPRLRTPLFRAIWLTARDASMRGKMVCGFVFDVVKQILALALLVCVFTINLQSNLHGGCSSVG